MKTISRMTLVASIFPLNGPIWPHRIAAVLVQAARFLSGPRLLRAAVLGVALMAVVEVLQAQGSAGMRIRIESWTRRDSQMELRLAFPTEFGRRYRIEASSNLVSWETKLVTEPSQGPLHGRGIVRLDRREVGSASRGHLDHIRPCLGASGLWLLRPV